MKKRRSLFQKVISLFTGFLLIFQSLTPGFFIASKVFAENEPSPTATEAPAPTQIPASEPTQTPASEPTQTPQLKADQPLAETQTVIPTTEPTVIPPAEPTVEPTITETPAPTQTPPAEPTQSAEPTPTQTPTPTPTPSPWTFENVELNKEYKAPQNNGVVLIFTKLPDPSGNIKIEEITLTPEQMEQTGALSDKAYDITSDMTDGAFSYTLSLPIPETAKDKTVEIKYAEKVEELPTAQTIESVTKTETSISTENLDHFTIFVIALDTPLIYPNIVINELLYNPSSGTEWIELYNKENYSVNLTNWRLQNSKGNTIPLNGQINSHSFITFNTTDWLKNTDDPGILNKGDTIYLSYKRVLGFIQIDQVSYCQFPYGIACLLGSSVSTDNNMAGKSIGRTTDGGSNWTSFDVPTRNRTNLGDIIPPVITPHENISVNADLGKNYTFIDYIIPTAIDDVDGTVSVFCTPTIGNFNIGITTISCSASDTANNTATSSFTVTVSDKEPPNTPTNISPENNAFINGATVTNEWSSISDAKTYIYESYNNSEATNLRWHQEITAPAHSKTATNVADSTFWWRVKAVDEAGNESEWSDLWKVTIDSTPPSIPTGLKFLVQNRSKQLSCGGSVPLQVAIPDWDDNIGDPSFHHFEYTSFHPNGSIGLNEQILTVSELNNSWMPPSDGAYGYAVRSVDAIGNKSDWALSAKTLSGSCQIIYDSVSPTVDLVFPTPSTSAHSFQAVFSEDVNKTDAENPANYFLNNWPDAGGSGDLVGDATISYDAPTKTATVSFLNPEWYISPEQQWGIQNIHDLAGNMQQTTPYTEYSTTPTPPVTTDSGIDTNWHNTPVTVTLTCTDINGSGCKTTYYTTDGSNPTTTSSSGNLFTLSIAGTYTIKYFSVDNAGNIEPVKTATNQVKIDTTSPLVQITAPTVSLTNSTSIAIRGTVTDNNPHHYWLVIQNAGGTTIAGPGTVNYSTSFTDRLLFTWNTTSVPDGTYTIKLEARDAADNKTPQSITSKTITLDKTRPTTPTALQFKNPNLSCGAITNSKIVTIDWSDSTDNVDIAGYDYSINYPLPSGGRGTWNTFFTQSQYRGSLNEGLHNIQVRAKDTAGNVSDWTPLCGITYDSIAPALTEQTQFEGWYNTPQTSTFTYTDTNGIVSGSNVTCDIENEGADQTCSVTPNVCDAAGNCNTTPVTSNGANIDLTMPTSRITVPENPNSGSTVYTNAWDGSILGTANDEPSGIREVHVSIRNSDGKYFDGTSFITNEIEFLLPTTFIEENWEYKGLTAPFEDSYLIRSHATDYAGNTENTYEITVIFDKTIPEVALSINPAVGDGENGWYKTQPEITLTANDAHMDNIQYQWDSKTGEWTTYTATFKPTSEGAHVLYYRAHDLADNYSDTGIKNIAWDKTSIEKAPQNVSVSPNPSNGRNVKVTWEAAKDNEGIDHYTITWKKDGVGERGTSVSETTREYIIPDTLTEGVWNVKVTAVDKAGFTADASANATVDLTAPAAPTLTLTGTGVGSVSLAWNAVEGAVDYSVWYGTDAGVYDYAAHVGNVTSYTIQGLGAGTYYVVVAAYDNVANRSAFSNEVNTGGAITGAPGATTGPAEGFQPSGSVLGTETTNPQGTNGQALGTTTTAPGFSWWFILIGLLLIIIALYIYYRQRRKNR